MICELEDARRIALLHLKSALQKVEDNVKPDLEDAINKIETINPSVI